jgi:Raf kinase inhibitor-like YbhB/YbcL family protein
VHFTGMLAAHTEERRMLKPRYGLVLVWLVAGCSRSQAAPKAATLGVSSPAFAAGAEIPKQHTCDGADLSPPLAFAALPSGAKSLALYVEDPDAPDPAAPKAVWTHWVAYDLPASTRSLPAGAGNPQKLGRAGKNDWGSNGYRGPCPPVGKHRYFVRVFALDRELGDLGEPTRVELVRAMQSHVLARGELMGTYQKGD